jgi:hypothetical protein
MHLPVLLAQSVLTESSPVAIGLVLFVGGGVLAFLKSHNTMGERVETLRQDHSSESGARKEGLEAEAKARREALDTERAAREKLTADLERRATESERERRELREMIHALQKEQYGTGLMLIEVRQQYVSLMAKMDTLLMREDHPLRRGGSDAA